MAESLNDSEATENPTPVSSEPGKGRFLDTTDRGEAYQFLGVKKPTPSRK